MTTEARPRHAYVEVIELDDTVRFSLPEEETKRINPPFRRPPLDDTKEQPAYEVPPTIGIVYTPADIEVQQRFDDFYRAKLPAGRHRAAPHGLFARLRARLGGVK
jgi:hypothetical protein